MPTSDRNKTGSQSGRQNDQNKTQDRDKKHTSGSEDRSRKDGMSGMSNKDNQNRGSGSGRSDNDR